LFEFADPKDTRLAKLSPLGVVGFDGGFEGPEEVERGVDRPEASLRLTEGKRRPEFIGGGFRLSFVVLKFQLRPFKSSIVNVSIVVMTRCVDS
jgi:hypothetical protein